MNPAHEPDRAYWEARLAQGPSLETVGWIGLGRRFNQAMYFVRAAVFGRRVRAALRRAHLDIGHVNVLDAGSGSGFYTALWQRLGVRNLTGCDLTQAVVGTLSQRFPGVPFRRVDIGRKSDAFPPQSFDIVSCMDVLFHIMDDAAYAQAFKNFASWLRPGGMLVITENCLHGARIAGSHQVSRTLAETAQALQGAGFQIQERKPVFLLMNTPVDSRNRVLRAMWRITTTLASKSEWLGAAVGLLLAGPELLAVSLAREGPSTEMLVCRKA